MLKAKEELAKQKIMEWVNRFIINTLLKVKEI